MRRPGSILLSRRTLFTLVLAVLFLTMLAPATVSHSTSRSTKQGLTSGETAESLARKGRDAYRNKEYELSARLLEAAILKGAREADVFYDASCSHALAGNKEKAFQFLTEAIRAGFRNPDHLQKDSDLDSLHNDSRWASIVAACEARLKKYRRDHSDPNHVRFITSDISRFWRAYDKAMRAASADRQGIFQAEYITPGSMGLKDFSRSGRLDAKTLTNLIETHSSFFKTIRPITLRVDSQRGPTVRTLRKFKQIYPEAIFPDVYFVVGQLSSGGTASGNGLLIGAEMFTADPSTPRDELSDWQRGAIMPLSDLVPLITHEFVHFQQSSSQPGMLCQCLREGSADFLAELVSGRLIDRIQMLHSWANAREPDLWKEFQKDLEKNATSHWLYGSSGGNGRPVDLGYWIGYKISRVYYDRSPNKLQAVKEILQLNDCKQFLAASHYGEGFSN